MLIRSGQLGALTAASRPAVVAAVSERLREAYGVTLEAVEDERLSALVDAAVQQAWARGVVHSASLFVFVSLAVLFGSGFEARREIAPLLAADGRSLDDRLLDVPSRLPESVWQSAGASLQV